MVAAKPYGVRSPPGPKSRIRAVRYPRVSRVTPDKFLARIDAHRPTPRTAGNGAAWVARVVHFKACGTALGNPKRAELLEHLASIAERVETEAAARM